MKKVIILMGIPGSGKGTQAKKIADKYGYEHISTGDLIRAVAEDATSSLEDKKEIEVMKHGGLVSSDFVYRLGDREIRKIYEQGKGMVLDGFARKVEQAKHYQKLFEELGLGGDVVVIEVHISDDTVMKRMQIRLESDGEKRVDDNPEVIKERIEKQGNKAIKPIVEYYNSLGQLVTVDGEPSIGEVERQIQEVLEN